MSTIAHCGVNPYKHYEDPFSYVFQQVTCSFIFVLFQLFINQNVQLIPAATFVIVEFLHSAFSAMFSLIEHERSSLHTLCAVYNILLINSAFVLRFSVFQLICAHFSFFLLNSAFFPAFQLFRCFLLISLVFFFLLFFS